MDLPITCFYVPNEHVRFIRIAFFYLRKRTVMIVLYIISAAFFLGGGLMLASYATQTRTRSWS